MASINIVLLYCVALFLPSTLADKGEVNKKLVIDFMNDCWVANNYEDTILAKYVSKDFKFHNPAFKNGWEGMRMAKDEMEDLEWKKVIADENDSVVVHGRCIWKGKNVIFIDIWRIENGLLAEHWDVTQEAPKDLSKVESLNPNPYF